MLLKEIADAIRALPHAPFREPWFRASLPRRSSGSREYVSLFVLAKQRGQHFRKVKQELDAAGIKPALDPAKVGATFYQIGDLRGWAPSSS